MQQYLSIILILFLFLPVHAKSQDISRQELQRIQKREAEQQKRQLQYVLEQARAVREGRPHNELLPSNRIDPGQNYDSPSNTFDPGNPPPAYDRFGNPNPLPQGAVPGARSLTSTAHQITQDMLIMMPDAPAYDEDGNLIAAPSGVAGSAETVLKYDGENRLKSVEPKTLVDGSTKVEYVYDYLSRRAAKKVFTYSSGSWSLTSSVSYIYDGWNLIQEIELRNPQPEIRTSYVWGLDLSGTLQGAGGIGGLLARIKDDSVQQYTYDGNGNVSELVNSDGSIVAHYEYDPYGISLTGADGDNPFRFSTKYLDAETGLYYYGYRYYSSVLGRWLSRDPMGEQGGFNLYGFVENSPVSNIDPVGLALYAFDGTANVRDEQTNVSLTHDYGWYGKNKSYSEGIGNANDYSFLTRTARKATGWGLKGKMKSMLDVMEEFIKRDDDLDVDIIGFSRGAITAIVFAAKVEQLKKDGVDPFCRLDKIRFMGLYDPVPGPTIKSPEIPDMVEKAAIAYSIDEKRTEFLPALYYGGNITANAFRGGHSDIGGGYADGRGLANITLRWMIKEGRRAGAPFKYPVSSKLPKMVLHQEYDWMFHYADRSLPGIPLNPSVNTLIFKSASN